MYSASLIALAFVNKAIEEGDPITQMKLQKLVYFAQGYFLATHERPLFKEEIQAWKFGPVVPLIYGEYKFYGSAPITDTRLAFTSVNERDLDKLDAKAKEAIEYTWNATKDLTASTLSNWSHNAGGPWKTFYTEGQNDVGIDIQVIKDYFKSFLYGEVAQKA